MKGLFSDFFSEKNVKSETILYNFVTSMVLSPGNKVFLES